MDDNSKEIQVKLSPVASIVVLVVIGLIGGGIYLVKPELLHKLPITTNLKGGSLDTLTKENYLPQIESSLKLMLRGQLLTQLANSGASQAEFDALSEIKIVSISAEPIGYFKSENAFWMEKDLRTVKIKVRFTAGGKSYNANGDFTVSGASDRISLGSVKVI
ncbi:hypothetical protein [Cerasicoccus maritimus]|uniref:hypothetical protein n=1 Tax=Cerasicoccus maritimus TaxID=490089 RepID=UPI0028528A4F|nr:hypothetical protein [Cerasicoccus maritimus]